MSVTRAYKEGDVAAVRFLTRTNPKIDLTEMDENGDTVLHLVVNNLLEFAQRRTSLTKVDVLKFIERMEILLQEGFDLNLKNRANLSVINNFFLNRLSPLLRIKVDADMDIKKEFIKLILKYSPQITSIFDAINYLDLRTNPERQKECFSYQYSHFQLTLSIGVGHIKKYIFDLIEPKEMPLSFLLNFVARIDKGDFEKLFVHPSDVADFRKKLMIQITFLKNKSKLIAALEYLILAIKDHELTIIRGMIFNSEQLPLYTLLVHINELNLLPQRYKSAIENLLKLFNTNIICLQNIKALPADLSEVEKQIISAICTRLNDGLALSAHFMLAKESFAKSSQGYCHKLLNSHNSFLQAERSRQRQHCALAAESRVANFKMSQQ